MNRRLAVAIACVAILPLGFVLGWAGWAGLAWLAYGHPRVDRSDPWMDRFMPRYEVRERHEIMVAATPAAVRDAAERVRLEDSPVIRAIFRTREMFLSARDRHAAPREPFLATARRIGWAELDSTDVRRRIFGAVTQPWEGDVRFHAPPPGQFAAFDSAGYVKIAWTLEVDSLGPDRARVRTETRALATDPRARALFRRYWSIFSPGIVLIRREALGAIRADAESRPSLPPLSVAADAQRRIVIRANRVRPAASNRA